MIKKFRITSFFNLNKYKIKQQLYLMYSAVVVVPIILIGIFLLLYTYRMMVGYHTELLDSDNHRVRNVLFEITTQIYNISENITFDDDIQNILTKDYTELSDYVKAVAYSGLLDYYEKNYAEISSITIYTDNPTLSDYKQFLQTDRHLERQTWYQKALSQSGVFWQGMSREDEYRNKYWNLSLIRKIPLLDSPYHAVLVIQVSDNYLRTRVDSNEYLNMISVDRGPVFYCSDRESYGQEPPYPIEYDQPYFQHRGRIRVDGQSCFINISALNTYQSDSIIYVCSLDEKGYAGIFNILYICGAVLLVALTIPGFLMYFFANEFTQRVRVLRQEMHKASNQDYELLSTLRGNDEISETFTDLQVMVQNIKEEEARSYKAQINEQELLIRQQEMEFKMLASQINPHFLYNTLETIRMKAFTAGDREAATAIKLLGQSMRYVLENMGTTYTTLKAELDHVDGYMKIQHLRFGDRIRYETRVEEGLELSRYRILPLLLQPVVENAIIHGLDEKEEKGLIVISIRTKQEGEQNLLFIDVEDNGCGMTKETLDKLHQDIEIRDMSRSKSIGLYNINQRMKLHYGNEHRIHLYAEQGRGTRVRLTIPIEKMQK